MKKRAKTTKTSEPVKPVDNVDLTTRVARLESQVAALQYVLRELTDHTGALEDDVDEILDETFGEGDSDA